MIPEEIDEKITNRITELITAFEQNPDIFLTERDIVCYLYHLLLQDFEDYEDTENGTKSIALHTEVRFYGESGNLRLLSDLAIMDVSTLNTDRNIKLPSKGYGVDKISALIEVKLRRKARKSNAKFVKEINKDRQKVMNIRNNIRDEFYSYIIAFDRESNLHLEAENSEFHKEFYKYPY
ncbi:MAG: hypothetical protein WC852_05935 [Candidatus Nanoarchaeia archaeon]|jgi:hypothetical protein